MEIWSNRWQACFDSTGAEGQESNFKTSNFLLELQIPPKNDFPPKSTFSHPNALSVYLLMWKNAPTTCSEERKQSRNIIYMQMAQFLS